MNIMNEPLFQEGRFYSFITY